MIEPAAVNEAGRHAVEADDVVCSEETVEDQTDHACDTVFGEIVHAVVDADKVLEFGAVVGHDADCDAKNHTCPGWDEAGCWGCGDEA